VRRYPTFVEDLPVTKAALEFAADRHGGQRRETDGAPFILHPLEVAQLLRGRDYPDAVIAAGVLHDVIEDTDVRGGELRDRFGPTVSELVVSVSEPPGGGPYAERKARLRERVAAASADAAAVFAADKVAKAREFRLGLVRDGGDAVIDTDKLDHYWACLALLEDRLGHVPLVRQLRFEVLDAEPATVRFPDGDGEPDPLVAERPRRCDTSSSTTGFEGASRRVGTSAAACALENALPRPASRAARRRGRRRRRAPAAGPCGRSAAPAWRARRRRSVAATPRRAPSAGCARSGAPARTADRTPSASPG
jgi:hypothetical protein